MYVAVPSLPTDLLGSGTVELGCSVVVGKDLPKTIRPTTCLKQYGRPHDRWSVRDKSRILEKQWGLLIILFEERKRLS